MDRKISRKDRETKRILYFGTVFRSISISDGSGRYVVVGLGSDQNDSFDVSRRIDEGRIKVLITPGTARPEDIERIVGRMKPENVIKALERGMVNRGYPFTDELRSELEETAQREPKIIPRWEKK